MPDRFKKIPYVRSLVFTLALFALYTLLGFLAAPGMVKRAVADYADGQLQRKASLGQVTVNPLLFKLELHDFALTETSGRPIVAFKRLLVDFELSSLLRWAWTFSRIELDALDLRAEIGPDGRFNLATLAERITAGQRDPGATLPRLLLSHVALKGGSITFSDHSDATPASATLKPLDLELRDFSTLPDRRIPYTLRAQLPGGGTLSWRGEASLQPVRSSGEISLKGVKPATAWRFLRDWIRLDEPAGDASVSARYQFHYDGKQPQLVVDDIRFTAAGVVLTEPAAERPLLSLQKLEAVGGSFNLGRRELILPSIELAGGAISAAVGPDGLFNWQKLVKEGPAQDGEPASRASAETPWKVKIDSVKVGGTSVRYSDHSRALPIALGIDALESRFSAGFEAGPGATLAVVNDVSIKLSGVTAAEGDAPEPFLKLETITVDGGSLDLGEHRLMVQRVAASGGAARIVREQDGSVRLFQLLAAGDKGRLRREVEAAAAEAQAEGTPWRFALDALDVEGVALAVIDRSMGEPVGYDVDRLQLSLKNIRNDGKTPIKFDADLRVVQGGTLRMSGEAAPGGERITASVSIEQFSLKPLQPVLASRTTLTLVSGEVTAKLKAEYRVQKDGRKLQASGPVSIDNLLVNETRGGERFLEWKKLSAAEIRLGLAPDQLAIGEVRIAGLGSKIVIFKDRSTNLAQALTPPSGPASGPPAAAAETQPVAKPEPGTTGETTPRFPVTIDRVQLEKAVVDFADLSLVLPFAAKIQDMNGTISGLSNDHAGRALVKLEGRVNEYGLARAEGGFATSRPKSFLDLNVVFRNVEMSQLSPYSVTFAGRRIESGSLSLDLQYQIDNGKLAGDSRVVLEKFKLGEHVETPGAHKLPLDLAVAVLSDSDGRIDIQVPVRGNVDDPQFSFGHLVGQAIATVIKGIVTAPFRALGALFGGRDSENPDTITFDAGRAELLPPEREKLKRVADALAKRPQLSVIAEGQYSKADREVLRQREVTTAIAAKLGNPLAAGGQVPGLNPLDARTQRAMEALFVERLSDQARAQFVSDVEIARGKPVERVNAALALIGRASSDGAFYEALLQRLIETATLAEKDLADLAAARARAVTGHLEQALSVAPARVESRAPAAGESARVMLVLGVARSDKKPTP